MQRHLTKISGRLAITPSPRNNPEYQAVIKRNVDKYADWVLTAAQLSTDMTLADIGTGEGLIALRAIERIGPSLQVILTDVSSAMLQHVAALAQQQGVYGQCRFLNCDAVHLQQIAYRKRRCSHHPLSAGLCQ